MEWHAGKGRLTQAIVSQLGNTPTRAIRTQTATATACLTVLIRVYRVVLLVWVLLSNCMRAVWLSMAAAKKHSLPCVPRWSPS
jgi:hypothetical protein